MLPDLDCKNPRLWLWTLKLVKAPLVLPKQPQVVEAGQGDFHLCPTLAAALSLEKNNHASPGGSVCVSRRGSIFVSANANLTFLRISENTNLTSLVLPVGMTNLTGLILTANQLTNLVLPPDLGRLETLNLGGNQLTSLSLPCGLTNVVGFFVTGNQLTNITLPPDMTHVIGLGYLGNPLTTVVLSDSSSPIQMGLLRKSPIPAGLLCV